MNADLRETLTLHLPSGACAAIRRTALEHPEASMQDLLAVGVALGLNASTIRIQVTKARRGTAAAPARPPVNGEHRQSALQEIARCREIARARWGVAPEPRVTWNKRGVVAGTARGSTEIDLNEHIAIAEGKAFLATVAHEYAHCVVSAMWFMRNTVFDRRGAWAPHGAKWQAVLQSFGHPARRCHNYASASTAKVFSRATVAIACGCPPAAHHKVTPKVADKIRAGVHYRCRRCRQSVKIA